MTSAPLARRKIQVQDSLPTRGGRLLTEVVVSACGIGVHEEGSGSIGNVMRVVLTEGESGFEEFSSGEVVLVFDAGDVRGLEIFGIRELRALWRQEGVLIVEIVDQETGGQDVSVGEIGLELGEIAEAEDVVVIGAAG